MSILAENIKYCRERKGMTQEALAKHFGLSSYKTVQKWEHDIVNPRAITISELSKLFGETMQDLYTRSIKELDVERANRPQNIVDLPDTHPVPIIGTIACGTPVLAEQNFQGFTEAPVKNADFALICKGESMINAGIHDGDIVYIKKVPEVENGKIAAVLIDNEATLKRVYRFPDRLLLQPANPAYPDQVYTEVNDVRILGLAVAYTAYIK